MTAQTLGERLQARLQKEEQDKLAKLQREAAERSAEEQQNLDKVIKFFDEARERFTAAILEDRSVPKITLGKKQNVGVYNIMEGYRWTNGLPLTNPKHPYNAVWKRFTDWAAENGLSVQLNYAHDGAGIESWHVLTVEPARTLTH